MSEQVPPAGASSSEIGAADTAQATVMADTRVLPAAADAAARNDRSGASSLVGMEIDGFALEGVIGGGAFGTVYRGTQAGLGRAVAFKVPTHESGADSVGIRRFTREARAAASIDHPGVVTIYAVGELPDGRPYIAMQFVDGKPLDRILGERRPTGGTDRVPVGIAPVRALRIARLVAGALSETHAVGVVHRDLKPSNMIWRTDRSGDDRITLVDFGVAAHRQGLGAADATRLTGTNLIGTPHYMSPEQAEGEDVDARTDLYALGCVLFELVTGAPPFAGSGFEVLLAHVNKDVPVASTIVGGVPSCVDRLIAKLVAKRPDDRLQTADATIKEIDRALAELAAGTIGLAPGQPVAARSPWRTPAAGLAVALALGGGLVLGMHLSSPATALPPPTTTRGSDEPVAADPAATREITADDGTFVCRVTLPVELRAKQPARMRVRVLTKFGAPIDAPDVVVTFGDSTGAAQGVSAKRRQLDKDPPFFALRNTFATPGHYVMRIFPPDSDSVFKIDLDVQ